MIFPYEAIKNPLDDIVYTGESVSHLLLSTVVLPQGRESINKILATIAGGTWSRSGPPAPELLGVEAGGGHALGRLRNWPEIKSRQLIEDF